MSKPHARAIAAASGKELPVHVATYHPRAGTENPPSGDMLSAHDGRQTCSRLDPQ